MARYFTSFTGIGTVVGAITVAAIGMFAFVPSAFAAATIESLKLTGPNTITIVYSQPVYTSPGDYTAFTGSFAGESVTAVNGSGSNTITLTLSGSVGSTATGYVTVGTNVQDVSDQQYFSGSTWNIVDGIGPALTSFSMNSSETNGAFTGTGNTITVSFGTNESVNIIQFTIDGHPISINGGGTGPFSGTYTLQSGDNQQSIPVNVTIADNSNNQTSASFTYAGGTTASGGVVSTASGAPVISSITSNANTIGVLTNGNSITFTLVPLNPEPNARITGSYNGVPLTWATTNGGVNYVATYVIAPDQSSQLVPLQISNVTLVDQNGNSSAPASGYDIQKTISVTAVAVGVGANVATPETVTTQTTATTGTGATTDTSALSAEIQSLESQLATLQTQAGGVGGVSASAAAASGATTSGSTANSQDGSAGFNFTEFLSIGSQNAQVTALQERLTSDGFYASPITGYYGTLTKAAVEKFQSAHGINVYGYVGPGTRLALNAGD